MELTITELVKIIKESEEAFWRGEDRRTQLFLDCLSPGARELFDQAIRDNAAQWVKDHP